MHFTDYWAIVEHDHQIQNPSSIEKMELLANYCRVRDGLRVLDVGCGKGWLMRSWASRWAIKGTGLEINPHFLAFAREQAGLEGVSDRLRFVDVDALAYQPEPAGYDIALCIGASFALGGFDQAVPWLREALKADGVLAIGEPFVNEAPLPAEASGMQLHDLAAILGVLQSHGLDLIGMIVASQDDWDHYESQHWRAAYEWAEANPDHPERSELIERISAARSRYLEWERRYIGWAIFVARVAGH